MLHYNITDNMPITSMRNCFLALLFFVSSLAQADEQAENNPLKVVVSIKPVHSLVAGIMQGVGRPELLLSSNQSPHHYSLRPSERRKLARADVIFWIGPNMEIFMSRLLHSLDNKTHLVSLMETEGLTLLPVRPTDHRHENQHAAIDAHVWMNTYNIEKMTDEITRQLVSIDPANAKQYKNNNKILQKKIKTLRNELRLKLKDKHSPFLTYHDGYQYFEREFNLKNIGFISSGPELQPSAKHIQAMKKLIYKHSIQCVFYDAPFEPPIMNSLLAGSGARAIELDPTGIRLPAGEDTLLQIMRSLGDKFQTCIQSH